MWANAYSSLIGLYIFGLAPGIQYDLVWVDVNYLGQAHSTLIVATSKTPVNNTLLLIVLIKK